MRKIRYVRMNPSGNLTCLVLDPVGETERAGITAALMNRCEQVGYLTLPRGSEPRARLEMMGGEFCGNASMAAAAWLADRDGRNQGEQTEMLLEVSGAEDPVLCRVRKEGDAWAGSVQMPLPRAFSYGKIRGREVSTVRLPGMVHLIYRGEKLTREEAETLLEKGKELFSEPAAGLLQWRETSGDREPAAAKQDGSGLPEICGELTPLVWVRGSETMVWESACGSGTAALACWKSEQEGRSLRLSAAQPGGTLQAETEWQQDHVSRVMLCGTVEPGAEEILLI